MATSVMVPLEEYLQTSYEPDCEWVKGELKERGMPDGYHGHFQTLFLIYFQQFRGEFRALSEVRLHTSPQSYRVPDVMVIRADARFLPLPVDAPLLCIEVLSPDDRASDLQEKIADYVAMGVGAIWIVDPRRRTMSTADGDGIHNVREFHLPGSEVRLRAQELFAELDVLEGL